MSWYHCFLPRSQFRGRRPAPVHRDDHRRQSNEEFVFRCRGQKREGYISWEDYFMGIAYLAAERSKDPKTQVGACVVNDENEVVGVGYNGFPRGIDDDKFPWKKNKYDFLNSKLTYVCHAEMNAIINAGPKSTKGCTVYVTLFPCNECAKIIIQAGIKRIVYDQMREDDKTKAALMMFNEVKIERSAFRPKKRKILIVFNGSAKESDSCNPPASKKERTQAQPQINM